jgi:Tol biopolymer transport system component
VSGFNDDVYTIAASGGAPALVVGTTDDEYWPAWSVDGTELVFATWDDNAAKGPTTIAKMPSSGGSITVLTDAGGEPDKTDDYPTW